MRFLHIIQEIFPRQWGIVVDVTLAVGVMVLFRDRFRLVAPSYGTKFAHALIKYRLSQMSLHRIHHPPQQAVHDARKSPLSSPRPKPIGALWLVLQSFPQTHLLLDSFRLGDFSGFPVFHPTRLLLNSFRLGDFSGFPVFHPTRLLLDSF